MKFLSITLSADADGDNERLFAVADDGHVYYRSMHDEHKGAGVWFKIENNVQDLPTDDQIMLGVIVERCAGIGYEHKTDNAIDRVEAVLAELRKVKKQLHEATFREDMGR